MVGKTISHYKILAKLGEGGMGVVYKAEDTRLERTVALKFLASQVLESEEAKTRFFHEAKAAAALDHPNVCTVYEVDEADGQTFIAMAYIDGPSLKQKIAERPLKLTEALEIAIQVGQGLQAAHEKRIVHRDIKSGNVMVTARGQAKIMDFGLAHLGERTKITKTGSTVGTPAYMSPEQAQGRPVDRRSDIWSLGVVLYEMATGRLPFEGEREEAMLYSILNDEPEPITAQRVGVPTELDRIVAKALAKGPEERYPHVEDMLVDLRALRKLVESTARMKAVSKVTAPRLARRDLLWGGTLVVVVAAATVAIWYFRSTSQEPAHPLNPVPFTSYAGSETQPSFSPDGNQVAFAWKQEQKSDYDIYVKLPGSGEPLRLTDNSADDMSPVWSPDGRHVAFYRRWPDRAAVYSVSSLGGSERKLADLVGGPLPRGWAWVQAQLAWSPDGESLAFEDKNSPKDPSHIYLLSLETHERRQLTADSEGLVRRWRPTFSPDGRTLAFVGWKGGQSVADIYLLPVTGGEPRRLTFDNKGIAGLAWTPDGREIVFSSDRAGELNLWRISASGGTPKRLAWAGEFSHSPAISQQGRRLVFARFQLDTNIYRAEVRALTDQRKPATKLIASTRRDENPYYSPDGKRIVFASNRSGNVELWVCDSDGSNPVQLTSFGGPEVGAPWGGWSPDGKRIAFDSNLKGNWDVYVIDAEGGSPRPLTTHPGVDTRGNWSPDGRWIYFCSDRTGSSQVWTVPAEGGASVQVTKQGGWTPMVSPDGKFVYYSKTTGPSSLWRVPAEGGEEVLVLPDYRRSSAGNWIPVDDGIYFADWEESGLRYSVFLSATKGWIKFLDFNTGRVTKVMPVGTLWGASTLAISPDGRWFLYTQFDDYGHDLMLVENFQ
jgi:Tol biopolymer transport system component/predicted Ser/Thr protein kinase